MASSDPELRKPLWWRRRWVTISEVVGIGALAIAVLGFFDTRRVHHQEQVDRQSAAQHEAQRQALVLRGDPVDNGERLMLVPVREEQVVQSQRYLFPRAVLSHAMQVDAAPPQVQVEWVRDGLRGEILTAAKAASRRPTGYGRLPVGVVTTYVEDGETRTDRSMYLIGFTAARGGLFGGGPRFFFRGLELVQRDAGVDLQTRVDRRWAAGPKLD